MIQGCMTWFTRARYPPSPFTTAKEKARNGTMESAEKYVSAAAWNVRRCETNPLTVQ